MKNAGWNINSLLLSALLGVAAYTCKEVVEMSRDVAVGVQRLKEHDTALMEAKQKIAQTEIDIVKMKLSLATIEGRLKQ